jgi:hypothetical protein
LFGCTRLDEEEKEGEKGKEKDESVLIALRSADQSSLPCFAVLILSIVLNALSAVGETPSMPFSSQHLVW